MAGQTNYWTIRKAFTQACHTDTDTSKKNIRQSPVSLHKMLSTVFDFRYLANVDDIYSEDSTHLQKAPLLALKECYIAWRGTGWLSTHVERPPLSASVGSPVSPRAQNFTNGSSGHYC